MAIRQYTLDYIHKALKMIPPNGISMCELGDQVLKGCNVIDKGYRRIEDGKILAKDYFKSLGIEHISIDRHGSNGAVGYDLTKPIEDNLLINSFDILTNGGTTEHVEDQYQCFLNIHNLVKDDGLMVHIVPHSGYWKDHPDCYFWYTEDFFKSLAEKCNYKIVDIHSGENCGVQKQVYAILMKIKDQSFITAKEFSELESKYLTHES